MSKQTVFATLLMLFLSAPLAAAGDRPHGYVTAANGVDIARTSTGECWRTKSFDPVLGTPACGDGPKDSDGDGVFDHLDQCPGTPPGVPVNEVGCVPDTDGDGVADYLDRCPNTPEGLEVGSDGCHQVAMGKIYFRPGSDEVTRGYRKSMEAVMPQIAADESITRVMLTGYVSEGERGGDALARKRAEAVRDYIVAHGVDSGVIQVAHGAADEQGTLAQRVEIVYEK